METEAPETIGYTDATLAGAINPLGTGVSYFFEYGTSQTYGEHTARAAAGSGTSTEPQLQTIDDPRRTHHLPLPHRRHRNSHGTTYGADPHILDWHPNSPPCRPIPRRASASAGATLTGTINPRGAEVHIARRIRPHARV